MVLLIKLAFNFFLFLLWEIFFRSKTIPFGVSLSFFFFCREAFCSSVRLFCLPQAFFFLRGTFSFTVTLFISSWDFLFLREAFSFHVRLFISPWYFLFSHETFYFLVSMFLLKIILPNVKISKDLTGYLVCA